MRPLRTHAVPRFESHAPARAEQDRIYDASRQFKPALAAAQRVRNTAKWRRFSARLRRRWPWCADPFGVHGERPAPTASIHHVAPLGLEPALAFRESNCVPLCAHCHKRIDNLAARGAPTAALFTAWRTDHPAPEPRFG